MTNSMFGPSLASIGTPLISTMRGWSPLNSVPEMVRLCASVTTVSRISVW